jgi:hypothetical protein
MNNGRAMGDASAKEPPTIRDGINKVFPGCLSAGQ